MGIKKQPSLMMNFFMNAILTMSNSIFPLITFPYISRIFSADGYGKVQLATAFISYFVLIAQLGIPTYGIRACAAVRENKLELTRVVHELTIIQTVMMVISYVIFLLCLMSVPRLQEEKLLYLICSMLIFFSCIGMEWLFKALEQYSYITTRSLVFKIIALVSMFLIVHDQDDYILYAGISVVSAAGSNIMNLTQLSKHIELKPVGGYKIARHIKSVFILFAYVCATMIYTNIDSVMLGFMTTDADVGYYSVAVKIKCILVSVVTSLSAVLIPRVSYYYENGMIETFWKMAEKAMRVILLITMPTTVFFMIFAKNGIFFLSGEAYANSVMPMIVIMPTLIFIGLTSVTSLQILVPTKRENVVLFTSIVAALVDIVINALLIPSMKSTGAAIGTLIAEFLVFIIQVCVLRKNILPIMRNVGIIRILFATALSCAVSFWVVGLPIGNFGILLLGAALFFFAYALVLLFLKDPFAIEIKNRLIDIIHSTSDHHLSK